MVTEILDVKIIVRIQTNKGTKEKIFEKVDVFDPETTLDEIKDYLWDFSTQID